MTYNTAEDDAHIQQRMSIQQRTMPIYSRRCPYTADAYVQQRTMSI